MTSIMDLGNARLWAGCKDVATKISTLQANFITARCQCIDPGKFQLFAKKGIADEVFDAARCHEGTVDDDEFTAFIFHLGMDLIEEHDHHMLSFCFNGSHRGPVIVGGVLILFTRASAEEVTSYIHSLRSIADFWSRYSPAHYTGYEFLEYVAPKLIKVAEVTSHNQQLGYL